jgi:phosphohistidine phosphatase SixA
MRFVLIRHGERKQTHSDNGQTSLSREGREQVEQLRSDIARLDLHPALILTSQHAHARETAEILASAGRGESEVPVISLKALTSPIEDETPPPPGNIEQIADETLLSDSDLHSVEEVVFVGHEPYLGQMVTRLSGARCRPLQRCELVCLCAPTFTEFLQGRGDVEFRYPVNDFQEEVLREKVQSKMSVSTFLAGFAFTALTLLLAPGKDESFSIWQIASIVCLTAALALFVASVYIYDRLSMPSGFWAYDDRGGTQLFHLAARPFRFGRNKFEENVKYHGILYAFMIWTWQYVFTPAVVIGLVGFIALLIDTNNWVVVIGGAIVIAVGFAYYWLERPRLGVD